MWLTAFKVALVVFLVVSVAYIIVTGVRRSRANRSDPRWKTYSPRPGHFESLRGQMPSTPRPDVADERGEGTQTSSGS